jgi:hypothetical protein
MKLMKIVMVWGISALAFGNGEGYSGPNVSGSSIPMELDGATGVESLIEATKVCEESLARDLYQQIWKKPFDGDAALGAYNFSDDIGNNVISGFIYPYFDLNFYDEDGIGCGLYYTPDEDAYNVRVVAERECVLPNATSTVFDLSPERSFPRIDYKMTKDCQYDEFGNESNCQMFLTDVEVNTFGPILGKVYFINSKSQSKTELFYGHKSYVECLKSQIQ